MLGKLIMNESQIKVEALNLAFKELTYLKSSNIEPTLSRPEELFEVVIKLAKKYETYLLSSSK